MPRDDWRNASDRAAARHAAQEYASDGKLTSFESLHDDPLPPSSRPVGTARSSRSRKSICDTKQKVVPTNKNKRRRKPLHKQREQAMALKYAEEINRLTRDELRSKATEPSHDDFHRLVRQRLRELKTEDRRKRSDARKEMERQDRKRRQSLRKSKSVEQRQSAVAQRKAKRKQRQLRTQIARKTLTELNALLGVDGLHRKLAGDELFKRMLNMPLLELIRLPDAPAFRWAEDLVKYILRTDQRSVMRRLNQLSVDQLKQLLREPRSPPKEWIIGAIKARRQIGSEYKIGKPTPMRYSPQEQMDWWREQT